MFKIKEDYLVSIKSCHKLSDHNDNLSIQTVGTFKEKSGKKYIIYKEYNDEFPEDFKTCIIKIEKDVVTLIKNGVIQSRLILEKDKRHCSPYYTDFGMLMMGIFTKKIIFSSSNDIINLKLEYLLDLNSGFVGTNEIDITLKKKETNY